MTPKERILAAIRGERLDRIPFTIYYEANIMSPGELERCLRNEGMGIVKWCPLWKTEYKNVVFESRRYWEKNELRIRETIKTPVGEVYQTLVPGMAYGTTWTKDFYIKNLDDYKVIEFMVRDAVYHPDYDGFYKLEKELGEDGIIMPNIGYSPFQRMWIEFMGVDRLSFDLVDRKKEFDSLYETILERQKEFWQIVADSPAGLIEYGGNISGDIIGPERFSRYHLPVYNELASLLHEKGKYLSVHMDGMLANLKEVIGKTKIDIIEAFTPPPDGNLSLKEARSLWKDKIIWINFPSSVHMASPEKIRAHTMSLLKEAVPGNRFLIGITENIPETVLGRSLKTISQTLQESGEDKNAPL